MLDWWECLFFLVCWYSFGSGCGWLRFGWCCWLWWWCDGWDWLGGLWWVKCCSCYCCDRLVGWGFLLNGWLEWLVCCCFWLVLDFCVVFWWLVIWWCCCCWVVVGFWWNCVVCWLSYSGLIGWRCGWSDWVCFWWFWEFLYRMGFGCCVLWCW